MNTITITIQLDTIEHDAAIRQALLDLYNHTMDTDPIPGMVMLSQTEYRLRMDKIQIKDKKK